jgi:PD-(D/E)XK endonuclease
MSKRGPQPPDPHSDPNRPNTKRTGERSEAAFLYQASQRRFAICKPWGDSERYDFILDNRPIPEARPERSRTVHLFRIQIKCTDCLRADAYETRATYSVGRRHVPYNKRDIDFIAAHVVPLNIWYIIPVEICTPQPMLRFYPHRQAKLMRLEPYREAWHLLDPPLPNPPITIHACIEEDYPEGVYPEFAQADEDSSEETGPRSRRDRPKIARQFTGG